MFSDDIDAAKDCVLKSVDKINKTLYLNPIFAKLQNLFKITDLAIFYQFLDFCLTFLKNKKIFEQTEKTAKAKIQILSKKFDLNPRSSFKFTSKINKFCINLAIEKFKIHFYFLKNDLKSYQIFSKFLSILKFCYKNAKPNDEKFLIEKIFNSSQLEYLINLEEKFINLKMDKILKIKDKWISFKTLFIFNKEIKISIFSEAVIELLFSIKRRFYILSHFAANLTENMLKRLLRILKNEFEIEKNNKAQICGFLNCCDHFYQILDNWKFGQNTNFSKITLKKSFHFLKLKLSNFVLDCFKTFLTEILFFDEMVDKKEFLNFSNLNSVLHDFYFDLSSCNKKTFVTAFFSCLNDKTIELLALIKNKKIEQNSSDLFLTKLDILDCYKIAKEILNSNCILFKFDEETVTVLSLLCAGSDSLKFLEEVIEHKNFDEIYFVLEKNKLNNLALENVKTFLD
ncbi:hypothetical protein MHBO_001458 [Bonamia ostreae]|uniref:Uncharacterized protein n=1 Tax=Bonamia ostreae TaxID=126728 RepID=A0ABV2AJ23_9EUKA